MKFIVVYKTNEEPTIKMGIAEAPEGVEPEEFARKLAAQKKFTEIVLIETPNTIDANSCDFWNEDGEVAREHF